MHGWHYARDGDLSPALDLATRKACPLFGIIFGYAIYLLYNGYVL